MVKYIIMKLSSYYFFRDKSDISWVMRQINRL